MVRGTTSGKSGIYGKHAVRRDRTAEYLSRSGSRDYAAEYRKRKQRLATLQATIMKRPAASRVPNKQQCSPKMSIKRRPASDPRRHTAQSTMLQAVESANDDGAAVSEQPWPAPQDQDILAVLMKMGEVDGRSMLEGLSSRTVEGYVIYVGMKPINMKLNIQVLLELARSKTAKTDG